MNILQILVIYAKSWILAEIVWWVWAIIMVFVASKFEQDVIEYGKEWASDDKKLGWKEIILIIARELIWPWGCAYSGWSIVKMCIAMDEYRQNRYREN